RNGWLDSAAIGALEVAPFVDRDLGAQVTASRIVAGEPLRDVLLRRVRGAFPVFGQYFVDLARLGPLGDRILRLLDLVVDDRVELLLRLCADQAPAVHEEVRRSIRLK